MKSKLHRKYIVNPFGAGVDSVLMLGMMTLTIE